MDSDVYMEVFGLVEEQVSTNQKCEKSESKKSTFNFNIIYFTETGKKTKEKRNTSQVQGHYLLMITKLV